MFECVIFLALPLELKDKESQLPLYTSVAKYGYDPGLQVGDEVQITNWEIGTWGDEPFSCTASVMKRQKQVKPQSGEKSQDIFRLSILLEVADKEDLPRVCNIFRSLNPGKFKD